MKKEREGENIMKERKNKGKKREKIIEGEEKRKYER